MIYRHGKWMRAAVLAAAATLLLALPALGGFRDDVARDLGVKTATLVAPVGEEWLIDLDAAAGIQTGDLFAVTAKGAPVVHPVTRQVIGSLDEIRAVLRVTKVKSGYSYTAVLSSQGPLKAGDEARRFAGLPAHFWDYTGSGEGIFTELQGALPQLDWQGYAAAQAQRPEPPRPVAGMAAGLIFVLNDQGLGVKDSTFQPLRFYRPEQLQRGTAPAASPIAAPVAAAAPAASAPAAQGIVAGSAQGAVPGSSSPGWLPGFLGGGSKTQPAPGGVLAGSGQQARGGLLVNQMDSREGVWYGPRLDGHPVGTEVADFDGDGKNEVALCFKDRLVVARVSDGKFEPLAEYGFGLAGSALSLDGIDLDGNGRVELYVSMVDLQHPKSLVVEMTGGKLEAVIKQVPFLMRKVHLGAEGYALLGQELNPDLNDRSQDLAGPIFRVTRSGDTLQRGAPLSVPSTIELFGIEFFEHGGRSLLARININDKLQVLEPSGAILWESSDYFGGSETSFERPEGAAMNSATRYAFLHPRIEPGPDGAILVPVNEGNRTFSAFRTFNNSHLKAVVYDGYSMVERWRTKPQGGYLADFRMADADNDGAPEIVMLVMFSRGGVLKSGYGNAALLIYEMQ